MNKVNDDDTFVCVSFVQVGTFPIFLGEINQK